MALAKQNETPQTKLIIPSVLIICARGVFHVPLAKSRHSFLFFFLKQGLSCGHSFTKPNSVECTFKNCPMDTHSNLCGGPLQLLEVILGLLDGSQINTLLAWSLSFSGPPKASLLWCQIPSTLLWQIWCFVLCSVFLVFITQPWFTHFQNFISDLFGVLLGLHCAACLMQLFAQCCCRLLGLFWAGMYAEMTWHTGGLNSTNSSRVYWNHQKFLLFNIYELLFSPYCRGITILSLMWTPNFVLGHLDIVQCPLVWWHL